MPPVTGTKSPSGETPQGVALFLWRVLKVTTCGSAFAGFAVGWVLLSYVFLPLLWAWPGSMLARRLRCQRLLGLSWVLFHDYMRLTGLVDFNPRRVPTLQHLLRHGGLEGEALEAALRGPVVVVANHPCLVDVTALVSGLGPMCFVVKPSLMGNPLFGPLLRFTGQISPDEQDGADGVVEKAVARLREGHNVLLFPEGTRSDPGSMHRFRLGAFEIARIAGVPVVPVHVGVSPPSLYKGLPWHEITSLTIRLRLRVLSPLQIGTSSEGIRATRELMERTKDAISTAASWPAGPPASGSK